jgi:hypothetical protein
MGAPEQVAMYRSDPKANHKHHDYYQVDELLRKLGIYDMPLSQQFAIAQPRNSRALDGAGTQQAPP